MFIIAKPGLRGNDSHGSGAFGAPRVGGQTHKGEDFDVMPGAAILCSMAGKITKLGRPYYYNNPENEKQRLKNELRYVQITDSEGLDHRYFYISPLVSIGQKVEKLDIIGSSQDIAKIYPGMINHVHYECLSNSGKTIHDPNTTLYR
jgi:murein DD-endopeptidase MepM/ murein hydrolase activator NlpD